MSEGGIYLAQDLLALKPMLERADVTDIYINRPQEIWVETLGGTTERHAAKTLTTAVLERLARQIAALSSQGINREHPLLSATLPDGARVQIVLPPATRGDVALAIRKYVVAERSLEHYAKDKAFDAILRADQKPRSSLHATLQTLRKKGDFVGLLRMAVKERCNILVSGGTSTGKTTFLGTLIREIDLSERLILIEDTPELVLHHENAVGLIATRSALGEAVVSMDDLLSASLRMRPDRIILGELRGPEAFTFLRAVNTGHPGSMTSVHADSPERAIEQIVLLILQSGSRLDRESIHHYVRQSIDIYVQLGRSGGRREVTAIELRQ